MPTHGCGAGVGAAASGLSLIPSNKSPCSRRPYSAPAACRAFHRSSFMHFIEVRSCCCHRRNSEKHFNHKRDRVLSFHHTHKRKQYIGTQAARSATLTPTNSGSLCLSGKLQVCNNDLRSSPHTQGPRRPGVLEGRPRTRTLCQGTGHGDPGDARWYTDRGVRRR